MPARTLPTFLRSEVESRNTSKSCYVTVGEKVYDVTDFIDAHPGGADLILEYGGKDIYTILKDEVSHEHSEAAYEILEDSLVGFLATEGAAESTLKRRNAGQTGTGTTENGSLEQNSTERLVYESTGVGSTEDLSRDTDLSEDYKRHKFLDLNKPLLMQVWLGGFPKKFYLEQVHRPRHYKGGASAPLFGNFLEPLSMTPWWVIPLVWIPPVAYGTYLSREGLGNWFNVGICFGLGLFIWTLVEYGLHRFLFHLD